MKRYTIAQLFLVSFLVGHVSNPSIVEAAGKPNVFFIVVDAMRADHLSCYGYNKPTTPNIDQLAGDATLFKTAITPVTRTVPSFMSMVTGLYPHTHGLRSNSDPRTDHPDSIHLAQILKAEGYETAAFINHNVIRKIPDYDKGFMQAKYPHPDLQVTRQTQRFINRNKKSGKPLHVMLWYLSPHFPYEPPDEYLKKFVPDPSFKARDFKYETRQIDARRMFGFNEFYSPEERDFLIGAYDAEINYVDTQIGSIIDLLKKDGLYENSIIIIVADHGESIGEHDYHEHGEFVYDVTTKVPLIIKRPYQKEPEIIDYQVRTIDIFPTILGLLDISSASDGEYLFPEKDEEKERLASLLTFGESDLSVSPANTRRYIKGVAGKWRFVRSNKYKLILIPHPDGNRFEFYDLIKDPGEINNLIDDKRYQKDISFLKDKLFEWIHPADIENSYEKPKEKLSQDVIDSLRSLGYMQ